MTSGRLGRGVSIVGAAYTPLGDVRETPEIKGLTEREMYALACLDAMEDAGIEARDIDAFYVGMSAPNFYAKMKSAPPHFGEWIGMAGKPSLFHDEGCGTSAVGLQMAVMAVASGVYECVLSGAVNINFSAPRAAYPPHLRGKLDGDTFHQALYTGIDAAYEKPGTGGVGPLEAVLNQYCKTYGVSYSELDDAVVAYMQVQRKAALMNPKASLITETYEDESKRFGFSDVKQYLQSDTFNPLLGAIIRARHMAQIRDGASAVIVCSAEKARQLKKMPIEVAGIATATGLHKVFADVRMAPDKYMFETIYSMAGITDPYSEVDYMGIHDCPGTFSAVVAEEAGYMKPGEAWKWMLEGRTGFDGDKPINTGGGRTQTGHPLSPAFVVDVAEAVSQMRGEAGPRQIPEPPKTSVIWGAGGGFNFGAAALRAT